MRTRVRDSVGSQEPGYTEAPALTIGGPTGDYFVECPITSARWAEYSIVDIVNGDDVNPGAIVVSGNTAPKALNYSGLASNTLADGATIKGAAYRLPHTSTLPVNSRWERITHSQKRVFVRIDCTNGSSMYVSIRFRSKLLTIIPGPSQEVHPDFMEEVNRARAETTQQRLRDMGIPGYAEEQGVTNYGSRKNTRF